MRNPLFLVLQRTAARSHTLIKKRTMQYVVEPLPIPTVPVVSADNSTTSQLPIHRIYCVGRNYADHVKEMGGDTQKDAPIFFCKPADAVVYCPATAVETTTISYPLATENLHHEVELVLAIGKTGTKIPIEAAAQHIIAYGVGLDLTRRDRQAEAKKAGAPWDVAKALDQGAPMAALITIPPADEAKIWCKVNGEIKQEGTLNQMIWSNNEIIHHLSEHFCLCPGDLIFTGTPAGVGPIKPGDVVEAGVDGLPSLKLKIGERAT